MAWIVLGDTAAGATSSSATQQLRCRVIAMGRLKEATAQTHHVVGQALSKLAEQLEKGMSEGFRTYLRAMVRCHRYSPCNVLLIAMQQPNATRVAGYRTWQKLGRQVRQGERGIQILAPVVHRTKKIEPVDEEKDEDTETLSGFRPTYAFDVSQTEGKPLAEPDRVQGDPGEYLDRLEVWVVRQGIKLEYAPWIGLAEGMSTGGRILLHSKLDAAQAFSVLVHELAHEMLHQEEKLPKTVRETEGEAVAFAVCESVGLESSTASSDYIQLYRGDRETLLNSMKRIHRTAGEIIQAIGVGEGLADNTAGPREVKMGVGGVRRSGVLPPSNSTSGSRVALIELGKEVKTLRPAVAVSQELFVAILERIRRLRLPEKVPR